MAARGALLFLLSLLFAAPSGGAQTADTGAASRDDSIAEADRLFTHGENPARDRKALEELERALAEAGDDYELLWHAARAAYHVADAARPEEKLRGFERGIQYAERGVALRPNGVEGHFWLGASWGKYAETKGGLKAWRLTKKVRSEMETVLKLRPDYEDGAAYLALGELDRRLPGLFGGSKKRARSYLEEGVRIASHNLELKLQLAILDADQGRREEARRLLEEILAAPTDPAQPRADHEVREEARRKLMEMAPSKRSST
jgi:tetratricopeptide (TPR) repeat protein